MIMATRSHWARFYSWICEAYKRLMLGSEYANLSLSHSDVNNSICQRQTNSEKKPECLYQLSPTKSLATFTRVGASVLSLWTCNIMRLFSQESPVVELKYVFPRLNAENDLSPTALIAGMTSNSFARVEISLNSCLREIWRDCKKVAKSLTSNSEVIKPHWLCFLW